MATMSSTPSTSKCGNCGVNNPSTAHYCARCGRPLAGEYIVVSSTHLDTLEYDVKRLRKDAHELQNQIDNLPLNRLKRWLSNDNILEFGLIILAFIFLFVYYFFIDGRNSVDKYLVLSNNGYYSLFKKDKQLTPYQYDTLILCSDGSKNLQYVIAKAHGKYGRLSHSGDILDSCKFDLIDYRHYIIDNKEYYNYDFSYGWALTSNNGLYGFIKEKKKGDIQEIPPQFLYASRFNDGFARVQYADKTYGWIDSKGHEVPWGKVYSCGDYSNGRAWISIDSQGKEYGYVDKKGNITDMHASAATQFNNNRAFISKGKAWAMIDKNLALMTDFVLYPRVDPSTKQYLRPLFKYESDKKCWQCSYNGKDCYVNKKGEILSGDQVVQASSKKKDGYETKRDSVSYLMGINFGSFMKGYDFGDIKWNRVSKGITDYVNSTGNQKSAEFEKQFEMSPSLINKVFNSYLVDRGKGIKGSRARRDSVAYLLGLNFGTFLKNNHFGALDNQIIKTGLDDYMSAKGDPKDTLNFLAQFRVNANEMTPVFNSYLSERKAQIAQANLQKENAFMADNRGKQGVIVLSSGLQYLILNSGNTNRKPRKNSDTVYVKYTGRLLDGSIFDATSGTEDVHFLLSRVIKGWQEGLKMVGEGGSIRLFVPEKLAYGDNWNGNIEPNSTLIFDIQLSRVVYGR